MAPGPARKPHLQVVREGNPGKRPLIESATVPLSELEEPDWTKTLPEVMAPKKPQPPQREEEESIEHFVQRQYRYEKQLEAYHLKRSAINATRFIKRRASEEWQRVVPILSHSVGLGDPDYSVVKDMCICVARIEWAEHEIARNGAIVLGQRGQARNPMTTIAKQYRDMLKTYIKELGLSPASRTGLPAAVSQLDDDDPFA